MHLVEGTELEAIWWPGDESVLDIADSYIERIVVTMEPCHMGMVPWAQVDYEDGTTRLFNLIYVDGIKLRDES